MNGDYEWIVRMAGDLQAIRVRLNLAKQEDRIPNYGTGDPFNELMAAVSSILTALEKRAADWEEDGGPRDASRIEITSVLGANTGRALVMLRWGKEEGMLTSDEARSHALAVLEGAEAAEQDRMIFRWLTETMGVETVGAASAIREMRKFRSRRPEDKGAGDDRERT